MGTTLQSYPVAQQLDSNLWSSALLRTPEGRQTLQDLHTKWVEAGADIVESCTYQSSLPLFLPPAGPYSSQQLASQLEVMNSAIPLLTDLSIGSTRFQSALSLGPFGASLQPGQEYGGLYPPPFGASSPSVIASGQEALDSTPLPLEAVTASAQPTPEDYLTAWHLLRLRHFYRDSQQFNRLQVLAFETVPNLYEATAIRRAMTQFQIETGSTVAFYIAYVFPLVNADDAEANVQLPDRDYKHLDFAQQAPLVIETTFGALSVQHGEQTVEVVRPDGIGFNCTSPLHAKRVTETLSAAYVQWSTSQSPASVVNVKPQPFFVLYPDGGAVYDVETRTWHHPLGLTDQKWANMVADAMEAARNPQVAAWSGVIGGGCCKAGPSAIKALRAEVEKRGWR
ncbi:homocysteine S-methyltransferase family protein [Sporobolomyces koalae]|uniref:homocysteine S-methyltransferase family protein n=1 Tax=Sporobolomyces koalae TaxID=500713 RepID=UPI0031772613